MSFWGATVITNLFSVIPGVGETLVAWIWGGFGVGAPTLNRFFTLHFLVPFVVLVLVTAHVLVLHSEGSSTPHVANHAAESLSFGRFFIIKDVFLNSAVLVSLVYVLIVAPNYFNHPDNYVVANPMQTPPHIVPEWYFLPFYAILRSVPNKLLGVVGMFTSILFLAILPHASGVSSTPTTRSTYTSVIWLFFVTFTLLTYLGSQAVSYPFVQLGFYASITYFTCISFFWFLSSVSWRSF
jgi:ubiquinol-cytochrome c reductase cytochrome b subunit